ncbi:TIGR03086 family metal-binding protein [Actinocatenispora rupis]|uniref:Mycothiol-dependent maleylpyruvate isomerase metal-binding domain-containing protein n=1 Tax=Actinocatenispora rupis TaxID=519421 RepID=A0A8J3NDF3_9ACTN|nr:TIGR03086 family metal-binding protein [Actinocatenispora rupis]GID11444.1 hypothetical protein Aru02nite_23330 [Actinocatenispora rupis]
MTGLDLLERSIGYTLGSLHLVTDDSLDAPTPCPAWSLRQLLEHMYDSLGSLAEAVEAGRVALTPSYDAGADPVAAVRSRACRLLGVWAATGVPDRTSVAGQPLATRIVAATGALEIAVHGWDVAEACGADRAIPDELAAELLRFAPLLVTDEDRPYRFGPPARVAPSAAPGRRLLAFLGRTPHVYSPGQA